MMMLLGLTDKQEEEDTGPSVDSEIQSERIEARRIRIQKRVEALRRAELGQDGLEKHEIKDEMSKSRAQIEESRLRLTKLRNDGFDLVTSIRVAGDARENARRLEEEDATKTRREKLEAEAKAGQERFEEITKKWETSLQKEIPQDLFEMLKQQKDACDAMIEEKNKLIDDFEHELKVKDDHYVKDLKKQAEDIDLMIERMDEQIKSQTREYRNELNQIEAAFVTERKDLLDLHKSKWEGMMGSRAEKEEDHMKKRDERVERYEKDLQDLRVKDAEEYNQLKIKLETDVQILEQQLQQMRATYQLNQEKLEYNFQVLKKRDEENTITKSQQKRKITRLQDVLNNLKIKLKKQELQYKQENLQLTEDYKRVTEQFRELQKKSKHFMAADAKKFTDVWIMNEQESKELLFKAVAQDRLIHEQQLGLVYEEPDLEFTTNVGPVMSEAAKKKGISASVVVREVMSLGSEAGVDTEESHSDVDQKRSTLLKKFSPSTIKSILELLCDESGFLVESKLLKLLAPLDKDDQSLMKLDAIFAALHIEHEDDIYRLATYFTDSMPDKQSPVVPAESPLMAEMNAAAEEDDEEKELAALADTADAQSIHSGASQSLQAQLIHPNDCLKGLRAFVEDTRTIVTTAGKQPQFKITNADGRDSTDDAAYWEKYTQVINPKKEKLWDALIDSLDKYSETLKNRASLLTETDALRTQNAELRMLLHQYINSKVNTELEIPPTRVLQLDASPQH
ncbi:dynein regulatory complex protein 1-like [Watersipora subatra]|uniref:dynein regulatory complex protein 1-like n=1 Tax=Watersipora subatra TaxID=2589382 RepID=UPI00355C9AFE